MAKRRTGTININEMDSWDDFFKNPAPAAPADTGMGGLRQAESNIAPPSFIKPVASDSMGSFRQTEGNTPLPVAGLDYEVPPPPVDTSVIGMEEITQAPSQRELTNLTMSDVGKSFNRGVAGVVGGAGGALRMLGFEDTGRAIADEMDDFSKNLPQTPGERALSAKPFEFGHMLTPEFWTDGRATSLMANAAGSSLPFLAGSMLMAAVAPASGAALTTAAITRLGQAALSTAAGRATIGKIVSNPLAQKAFQNTVGQIGDFGKAFVAARVLSAVPEAFTEGGGSYNEMAKWNSYIAVVRDPNASEFDKQTAKSELRQMYEQNGGKGDFDPDHAPTIDDAKLRAWKQTALNIPLLAASNAAEGVNLFSPSKNIITGTARKMGFGALQGGGEEFFQEGFGSGVTGAGTNKTPLQGEEFVWSLDPSKWNPQTKQAVAGGGLFGGVMGAAGGGSGPVQNQLPIPAQGPVHTPTQVQTPEQGPAQPKLKIGDVVPDDQFGDVTFSGMAPDGQAIFTAQNGTQITMPVPAEFIDPSAHANKSNIPGTVPLPTENTDVTSNPGDKAANANKIEAPGDFTVNMKPEKHEVDAAPVSPPNSKWKIDPGAMPGEPEMFFDVVGDNFETAKAAVFQSVDEQGKAVWESSLSDGKSLGQFTTVAEAASAAEKAISQTIPINNQGEIESTVAKTAEESVATVKNQFSVGDKVTSSKGSGMVAKVTKSGIAIKMADGKTVSISFDSMKNKPKESWVKKESAAKPMSAKEEFEQYHQELAAKYDINPAHNLSAYGAIKNMEKTEIEKWNRLQNAAINNQKAITSTKEAEIATKPQHEIKSDKINIGDTVTRPGKDDGFVVVDDSDPSMFVIKTKQGNTLKTGKKGVVKSGSVSDAVAAVEMSDEDHYQAWKKDMIRSLERDKEEGWGTKERSGGLLSPSEVMLHPSIAREGYAERFEREQVEAAIADQKTAVGSSVEEIEKAKNDQYESKNPNYVSAQPETDAEVAYRKAIKYDKATPERKNLYDLNFSYMQTILNARDSYEKYAGLRDAFISNDNVRWMAAYDAITGEKIPRKQGERLQYLQDKYPEEHKKLMAAKAEKRSKTESENRRNRINSIKVNHNGEIIGRADFIDYAIDGGYRNARRLPQGAAFAYHLMGNNGKGFVLANKEEFLYAAEKIDAINDAEISADPEVDALFEGGSENAGTESIKTPIAQSGQNSGQSDRVAKTSEKESVSDYAAATTRLSNKVVSWIKEGHEITWRELFSEADKHFGGTQAEGRYTSKDAYDAMERGVNKFIESEKINPTGTASDAQNTIERLRKEVIAKLPTQTKRTAEQDEFQQFSTPPDLAFAVAWTANITAADTVLEPSAGIGGIAIYGKTAGAKTIVNELSERRRDIISTMGFDRVFGENAEQLDNILPNDVKPDIIIMNPPFSSTAGRVAGERKTANVYRHLDQALSRLNDGGRLVAVVGEGLGETAAHAEWWKQVKGKYNVRANIALSGEKYVKYGTTFDNRIIVIDKTGPTTQTQTASYNDVIDALDMLGAIRNARLAENRLDEQGRGESGRNQTPDESRRQPGHVDVGDSQSDGIRTERPENQPKPKQGHIGTAGSTDNVGTRGHNENTKRGQGQAKGKDDQPGGDRAAGQSKPIHGGTLVGDAEAAPISLGVVTKDQEKQKGELTDSIYDSYKPQRLSIPGAKKHPSPLVQSAAMASVEPPLPTYAPKLPKSVIDNGLLSEAQLESIVYAGQAHEQILPSGLRKGFMIGDGTGVGKGREISGIILDNFGHGRKKAVWVSEKPSLYIDARRDWSGIGQDKEDVFELAKIKGDIKQKTGILFSTYKLLTIGAEVAPDGGIKKKEGKESRLEQIAKWLGPDFDGVVVFDEAHNMQNAVSEKGARGTKNASQTGLAGIELQKMLPKARILYVSATGATKVSNLSYMERLGLWGEGTPFASRDHFISSIESGGLAAMELVARDMKALGSYIQRSLSYDGVTYGTLEHKLTLEQTDIYNKLANAWQIVLQNIEKAVEITGMENKSSGSKNGMAKGRIMSAFWGANQRFFNQVITSMQMPSVIESISKDIKDGNSVVLQLVNTNEAETNRKAAQLEENETLEDLDLTPREALMNFLEKSFPVQVFEQYMDENRNMRTRPVFDSKGNPVVSKEAVALRERLLDELGSIRVPDGPLEILLNTFGDEKVAEVTGRSRRFVRVADKTGQTKMVEQRRGKVIAEADADLFINGKKPILVFSDAGGTGRSYHADRNFKNQNRRVHYLLQPGWRADKAIQGFGRTHRTNQVSAPHYVLVTTDLMGQKRFVSSIARRLDQLGALTRGQRQTGGQGMFKDTDNLEGFYAFDAMEKFYTDLIRGNVPGLDAKDILAKMGLSKILDDKGSLKQTDELRDINKFLNRILSLEKEDQNTVFNAFHERMVRNIDAAIASGTYETGLQNFRADKVELESERIVHTAKGGAETKYAKLIAKHKNKRMTHGDATAQKNFIGIFQNAKSGKVWAAFDAGNRTYSSGSVEAAVRLRGPSITQTNEVTKAEFEKNSNWVKLDPDEAATQWEKAYSETPEYIDETIHLITGAILPIWDRLPETTNRVVRVQTVDGSRYLGRRINDKDINNVLSRLGVDKETSTVSPADAITEIIDNASTVTLANGWRLSRARVSGDYRIELTSPKYDLPRFDHIVRRAGVFTERVNYVTRYFVPVGKDGETTLNNLFDSYPVADVNRTEASAMLSQLSSGVDPFRLIPGLRKYSDMTVKEAFNDLVAIGRKVYAETSHGGKWMARMKELLGDLWGKAKNVMGKVWNEVKRVAKDNAGATRIFAPAPSGTQHVSVAKMSSKMLQEPWVQHWANHYWQSVGEKSPFFRAWFGDWRQNEKTPVPVIEITGMEVTRSKNIATAAAAIGEWARRSVKGSVANKDTGWVLEISNKTISETTHYAVKHYDLPTIQSVVSLRDVVENAILHSTETNKHDNEQIPFVHVMYAPINIGSDPYVAELRVRETPQGAKPYYLEAIKIKPSTPQKGWAASAQVQSSAVSQSQGPARGQNNLPNSRGSTITVSELLKHVNNPGYDRASAVVGSNKKPLIVYHGTGEEFTEFLDSLLGSSSGRGTGTDYGFFFAQDEEHARYWADNAKIITGKSVVMPVYLDIKDPVYITDKNDGGVTIEQELKKAFIDGHDGAIIENALDDDSGEPRTMYVSFDPTQIKSINNRGTFDGSNANVLYSFPANIAHLIPALSKHNDMTAPEAMRDLVRIGRAAYESGITNGGKWMQKMREVLGDLWSKFQHLMVKVWREVKKTVNNNRGAIRLGGQRIEASTVVIPADADAGGKKTVEQLVESGWISRDTGRGTKILVKPETVKREVPESFEPVIPGMDRGVAFEFEQSSEVPEIPTGEKLRDSLKRFWAYASRKYSTLPRSAEFAPLEFGLTQLEHKKGVATDTTVKAIREIVSTLKNKKDYQIFSHKVVFDDLAADLAESPEYDLPFGLTKDNFQSQYDAVNAAVTPEIQQALDTRKQVWNDFKEKYANSMKAIGFDVEDRLKKGDTYFHHIVLDYAELKKRLDPVLGTQIRTPSYRGFLKSREGSTKNILTDYLQPEMEVMGQMMYDVEIAKVIKMVSDKYDIQSDLQRIATASNEHNTIKSLIDEQGEIEGIKSWNQLSKKQAMAMNRLAELAYNDELPNNGKFNDVLEALIVSHESQEQLDLPKNRLFAYLSWVMHTDNEAGKMTAGLMFKGLREKAAAIKERLGDEHLSWRDLVPEGYETWQPREGNIFYTGYTIPEHIAQGIADKAVSELGIPANQIRRAILQGGRRKEMVVPVEVASTLEEIVPAHAYRSWVLNGLTKLQGKWKQAVLQMPNRFLSYNFNNMVGDLDAVIAAQGTKAMKKTMTAARELYGVFYRGKEMSPHMQEWFNRGGFETLLQTQEAGKVNQLATFDRLMEREKKLSKLPFKVWQTYWQGARKATDFREAIMRYAKFLDYVEQMEGSGVPNEFGASDPASVMALDNRYDRAFKLSNELLGAYDSISEMGRDMRSFIWPFWSWKEVNATRYAQMIRNATVDSSTAQDVAGAIGGQALRRAPFAAVKAGAFMVKATFLWALIQTYNWWMWPEEERDLEDGVKYKMHIILGRDQDGKVRYAKASGALADLLGWVSLDTPMQHYDAWLSGRKSLKEIAADMAAAPTNIVLSGITPYFKVAAEMIYGESVFPDWRKPRPIRDKGLYLASSIALGNEYRSVFGLPSRGYSLIDWSVVKKSDPLQAAYYSFMGTKQRFMESKGKGEGFFNSPKSEALRNYKEALRYQDEQAAVKYLEQYKLAGGTKEGIERSMESMNPTAGLKVSERKEFLASLNPEDRRKMAMGQQYFDMVIARSGGTLSVTKKGVIDVKLKGVDLPSEKKPKKQNFF
jgi:tRNA G10  N-methylase Trm11